MNLLKNKKVIAAAVALALAIAGALGYGPVVNAASHALSLIVGGLQPDGGDTLKDGGP